MCLKHKMISTLGGMVFCMASLSIHADPGSDMAIIAKLTAQLKQLEQQYRLLDKTYNNAQSQLKGIDKLTQYNSGHSGFGRLHNSLPDLRKRQSANTWRDTLKGISGGNPDRYQELVKAYEKRHVELNKQQFRKGASASRTERFDELRQNTQAASVESEASFNDINESMKRIHDLSEQIEKAENTKAAVDLNSRLLTEIAYLQAQNLKAQAMLNQQLATSSGANLGDEAELARYLTLDSKQ